MKKTIYPLLLLVFGLIVSCSQNQNTEKNVQLIDNYVKAVESLDQEAMSSILDDNYMGYGPSYGDSINKTNAIANWKYNVEHLYESIKYSKSRSMAVTVPDGENEGDWVSNWAELNIKFKEDLGEVNIWANSVYKIENGKIVRSFTFYNEADALEQLGYVFLYNDNF